MNGISVRVATEADVDTIVFLNQSLIQADAGQRDPATNLDWSAKSGHDYFTALLHRSCKRTMILRYRKICILAYAGVVKG